MKSGWRLFGLLGIALSTLNCFKEPLSPVLPTWDVTATFPLGARTYTLGELIAKDTTLLKRGEGSAISFSKTAPVAPAYVNDYLVLNPKDTAVQFHIGAFRVSCPPQRRTISIPWLPQGQTVPVPDTTMQFADIQSTIEEFEFITIKSGTISLTIDNNLPVVLEVPSPIRLIDFDGRLIATFVFPPIPGNSSRTAWDDLADKTFSNDYRMTGLQFHTPGSQTPVTIPTGDLLVVTLSTNDLRAREATMAFIPAQHIADNDTAKLRIDDSTLVKELYMKSGGLNLAVTNNVSVPMVFQFRFNELDRWTGSGYVPYRDSLYLTAGGSGSLVVNFTGTRIRSITGNLITSLAVMGSVSIIPQSGQPVSISETDRISVTVSRNSSVVIDSAVGVVKPTWVDVDTKVGFLLSKTVQRFSGQLNLPAAQLRLSTASSIGFPADAYVRIGARKATGDSVFLNVPVDQRRITPGQDEIQFSGPEVGSFMSQLSAKLPDSLRIVGRFLANPEDVYTPTLAGVGSVGSRSSVSGSAHISIPLNFGIVAGTVNDTILIGDTTANGKKGLTIDESFIERYNTGKVYVELENGLPAAIAFNTALLNKFGQNLLTLPQSGQMIHLAGATVDGNGNVIAPARSTTVLELNRSELAQYNPSEFLAFSLALNTSPGSPAVQFKTEDRVKIRLWTQVWGRIR